MGTPKRAGIAEIRGFFARLMEAATGLDDPRYERAFAALPREAFLPPGPWKIGTARNGRYVETPSADPVYLYTNSVVALDAAKGINNGEPLLHAAWMGAIDPQRSNVVSQIGVGGGYFTALLAMLVGPDSLVHAIEVEDRLAAMAARNLEAFNNVVVVHGDATRLPMPASDIIYVNAGVAMPPSSWLEALKPNGRMIFPWRASEAVALAIIVSRRTNGLAVRPLMPAFFIPCIGASDAAACQKKPTLQQAWSARSLWLQIDKQPDESAIAICPDVWFSSEELAD